MAFDIPKKSGGVRRIEAPATALKIIQRKLSQVLLACYRPPASVHGFAVQRSILTNAAPHGARRLVVNVNIADFFTTINFGRVYGLFRAKPFEFRKDLAAFLANIACHNNHLPQGAPSSPVISNMVSRRLDRALMALAAKRRYTYTRYADDLTFSTWRGEVHPTVVIPAASGWAVGTELAAILAANGFAPNTKKVRVFGRARRQQVTGLVVNVRPNVVRGKRKQIRAMLHAWERFGLEAAREEYLARYNKKRRAPGRSPPDFKRVLHGRLAFLESVVSSADPGYVRLRSWFNDLAGTPKVALAPELPDELLAARHANVWVVESEGDNQGTAFRLDGYGFVTCAHVLRPNSQAYRGDDLTKKFEIEVLARNDDLDLAIFRVLPEPVGLPPPLVAAERAPKLLDKVEVWGFPNHNKGDSVGVRQGHVAGFRPKTGLQRILVNAPIIYGNSGGPILNVHGQVIGVAVTGAPTQAEADSIEEHGVIPVGALQHLTMAAPAST
ncbi:MAG: trypsin-like peptidase domain-containing protein [Anaeromyxobacter sp.]